MSDDDLYDIVLCMEQIMSTGGGWQDQVGGVTPGIKFITTKPGIDQKIQVEHVELESETLQELEDLYRTETSGPKPAPGCGRQLYRQPQGIPGGTCRNGKDSSPDEV